MNKLIFGSLLVMISAAAQAKFVRGLGHTKVIKEIRKEVQRNENHDRDRVLHALALNVQAENPKQILDCLSGKSKDLLCQKKNLKEYQDKALGIYLRLLWPEISQCKGVEVGAKAALILGVGANATALKCQSSDYRTITYFGPGLGVYMGIGATVSVRKMPDVELEAYNLNKIITGTYVTQDMSFVLGVVNPEFNEYQGYGDIMTMIADGIYTRAVSVGVGYVSGGHAKVLFPIIKMNNWEN